MKLEKILYYESKSFNPYLNLAMEEQLLNNAKPNCIYFYLWQNKDTVVIGKNQCAFDECKIELMEKNNVKLARRSSGGGAVYHDLGNLNFTFIAPNKYFNKRLQLEVIKKALEQFNLIGSFSGRNDLLIDGFKISGQAYLEKSKFSLHHGTLLIDVDIDNLGSYLKIDKTKLKGHGVKSHSQRVKNIKSFNNLVTVDSMKNALKKSIESVYKIPMFEKELNDIDYKKYCSKEWLYRLSFAGIRFRKRFEYGLIDIHLDLIQNVIKKIVVNSDLMNVNIINEIENQLIDKIFNLETITQFNLSDSQVENDIKKMLIEKIKNQEKAI